MSRELVKMGRNQGSLGSKSILSSVGLAASERNEPLPAAVGHSDARKEMTRCPLRLI